MRLNVVMEIRIDDPVAVAAYLLGPAPTADVFALPAPEPIERQAERVIRDALHEHLTSDTGLTLERLHTDVLN